MPLYDILVTRVLYFCFVDYTENPSTDQSLEDTESKSDDELELEISPEETLNDMETEMLDCV